MDKSKPKKSPFQDVFLPAGSLLCLLAAVVNLLQKNYLYSLIFVILQGCLTLLLILMRHEQRVNEDLDLPSDAPPSPTGFSLEMMNRDAAMVSELRQQKEDLVYQNETLNRQIEAMNEQNEKLLQLLTEAELKTVASLDPEVASSILPSNEQVVELDLIALARSIVEDMQPLCGAAGIRLELSTSSPSLPYQADRRYMTLMLRNIIDNSIKYMQQNGNLVITISNAGSNLFFAFKDNGRGLSQEEMPNIFDLNFQGSNRVSGNGLGLAQVKAIVEHYHGTIYAHCANGMGIYIQLPIAVQQ